MFKRQRTGSVVCPSCGNLVGVNDNRCYTCGRWNPGLWGLTPLLRRIGVNVSFSDMVVTSCSILYALMLLASGRNIQIGGLMSFLAPSGTALDRFGASGAAPVFYYGRWWTVLSASWLHFGLLHILFNMMWIRQLGPASTELYGTARTIIIYVVGGAVGFLASSTAGYYMPQLVYYLQPPPLLTLLLRVLGGAPYTLGASASIFALLGAMVHYGRQSSSIVKTQAAGYALMLFVFGLLIPGVDNWAHAGGFVGGYAMSWVLNPLRRERGDHMLIAAVCLIATVAAILASLVSPVPQFPF